MWRSKTNFSSLLTSLPHKPSSLSCLSHPSPVFHTPSPSSPSASTSCIPPGPPWYSRGLPVCCWSVWTLPEESLSGLQTVMHKADHLTPSRSRQHIFLLPLHSKKHSLESERPAWSLLSNTVLGGCEGIKLLLPSCACWWFHQGVFMQQVCSWPWLKPGLDSYLQNLWTAWDRGWNWIGIKGTAYPNDLLSSVPIGKVGEVSMSTKRFWSLTAKQRWRTTTEVEGDFFKRNKTTKIKYITAPYSLSSVITSLWKSWDPKLIW